MRILIIVAVAFIVWFFLRKRDRKVRVALSSSSPAVDRWLKEALPTALAGRLGKKGIARAQIATTLDGDPDPDVVSEIETAVKAIEIEYRRDPHVSHLEVRARVRFDDGTEENVTANIPYEEAPASVRDDFEKKATTRAFRTWDFPWMNAR
jgi:hypothetical protein